MTDAQRALADKAMIESFYKKRKPSVTFEDGEKNYQKRIALEKEHFSKIAQRDALKLQEHQASQQEKVKRIESIKDGTSQSIQNVLISLRAYEKQFKCKQEGLEHFTNKINEEFKKLGYKKKEKEEYIPEPPEVDLRDFRNVDEYYDYHEAMKMYERMVA